MKKRDIAWKKTEKVQDGY